jgi:hypothetical protein
MARPSRRDRQPRKRKPPGCGPKRALRDDGDSKSITGLRAWDVPENPWLLARTAEIMSPDDGDLATLIALARLTSHRTRYVVTIGASGERWGTYRRIAHAQQALRALRDQGFRARIESVGLRRLLLRVRAIEDLLAEELV